MYLIFDLETETHHSHKRKSNPFNPDNYVVMRGWKKEGDDCCSWVYYEDKDQVCPLEIPDDVDVLVGHNIKFDLLYEMMIPGGRENLLRFIRRGGKIYCTQYGHYLLNGMHGGVHMASMDSIIEEYGGRKKIDGIKALWDAGVMTSEIDPELLTDYLVGTEEEGRNSGDIGNTELIYLGQQARLSGNQRKMFERRMDGLLATTEMEYNGLFIDVPKAKELMQGLMDSIQKDKEYLDEYIREKVPAEVGFNWNSPVHVSCLLFGGTIKYQKQDTYLDENGQLARKKATEEWPLFRGTPVDPRHPKLEAVDGIYYVNGHSQDLYKSGKKEGQGRFKKVVVPGELKVKYQDFFWELPKMAEPLSEPGKLKDGKGGPVYSVDSDTIQSLGNSGIEFLKVYSRYQAQEKDLGTYYARYDPKKKEYVGMLTCVGRDRIVHHSLNHVNTVTGRLSSNNPNLQNIPKGNKSSVKSIFVSRFDGGKMVEIDYSQLEIVVQGLLSLDPQLIKDLNNKIDFHCKRVGMKKGISYDEAVRLCKTEKLPEWVKERDHAKFFSFQRAYGAGKHGISASTGIPLEDVELLIQNEEREYPGITKFNEAVEKRVNETAEPFRDPTNGWKVYRRGTWEAKSGTVYSWRSYDAPEFLKKRGQMDSFSPPEMKNYPVQGTGGEFVQMAIGYLVRWMLNKGFKARLVNTVHDSVWIDCPAHELEEVITGAVKILESIPRMIEKLYGWQCPVPFPVEAEIGDNLLTLEEWR